MCFTEVVSFAVALVISLVHKDVSRIVHAVEIHELVHQFQGDQGLLGLMDFLAKRVLPEKSRVLVVLGLLFLDDLWR